MEKVAEEIKFDVLPNDNKKRHNRLENRSPSLTFEEAGCLKNLPTTSKGGRPHSDIVSDFKAYQTKQFSRDIW